MGEFTTEAFVRPALFPGSQGRSKRIRIPGTVASEEENRGAITITGAPGQLVKLRKTYSYSMSTQQQAEAQRTYDVMRVKNPDDPDQFVDVEAITRLALQLASGVIAKMNFARPEESENIERIERDSVRDNPSQPRVVEAGRTD